MVNSSASAGKEAVTWQTGGLHPSLQRSDKGIVVPTIGELLFSIYLYQWFHKITKA